MASQKIKRITCGLVVIVAFVCCVVIILNREWIYDWWRGITYQMPERVSIMRSQLQLTDRGMFLFNASQPVLSMRDEFNEHCRGQEDEDMAVLGCYVGGNIYVYDINAKELEGIKELTLAHELLHAVWERMSNEEKASLDAALRQVQNSADAELKDELATYGDALQREELYVRAGTEVKDLPEELEKHYAQIFKNQDAVVDYYNKYIAVFRETKKQIEEIKGQMDAIYAEYDALGAEYEQRAEKYDSDVNDFNRCANTANCFSSDADFETRRRELVAEGNELTNMYNRLDGLVDSYNALVKKYNDNVLYEQRLNDIINSNSEVSK